MVRRQRTGDLALIAGLWVLAGCAPSQLVPVATEADLVGTRIAQASEKAANALDSLAAIEQTRTPLPEIAADYASAPPNLLQPITLNWTGPVEQVAQMLATRAGYTFNVLGGPLPVPVTVTLNVYDRPLIQLLRDIGLQVGQRASLTVDGSSGVVELRYAPVDKI